MVSSTLTVRHLALTFVTAAHKIRACRVQSIQGKQQSLLEASGLVTNVPIQLKTDSQPLGPINLIQSFLDDQFTIVKSPDALK